MRRRSFTPAAPACLEGRDLPSAFPGPAHLSAALYGLNLLKLQGNFQQFALYGNLPLLRSQLAMRAAMVPFARVDGLGVKTNAIIDRMQANLAEGTPGAIYAAYQEVRAGVHSDLQARIDDGSVVVVP
jgi:hypothetical protein